MSSEDIPKRDKKTLSQADDIVYDGPDAIPLDATIEKEVVGAEGKSVQDYLDSYSSILDLTKDVKTSIDVRCEGYVYKFDPNVEVALAAAIRKVFGADSNEITYEMYLQVIEEQIEVQQENGDEIFGQ